MCVALWEAGATVWTHSSVTAVCMAMALTPKGTKTQLEPTSFWRIFVYVFLIHLMELVLKVNQKMCVLLEYLNGSRYRVKSRKLDILMQIMHV